MPDQNPSVRETAIDLVSPRPEGSLAKGFGSEQEIQASGYPTMPANSKSFLKFLVNNGTFVGFRRILVEAQHHVGVVLTESA